MGEIDGVQSAFAEVLDLPDGVRFDSLAYRRTAGWDSNAHMRIVALLEKDFGIMFSPDDIVDMESFNACLAILREHGVDV